MAQKLDFAQKLLHDLRLRKERMSATQNSSNSNFTSRGGHGNPGPAYKSSRQMKTIDSVGARSGNSTRKTGSGSRQLHIQDSSNQIVLYGKGRSSEHIADLSTALAFAFGNGGKFNKIDASGSNQMLNFLHQIGRKSLDTGRMEIRSTSIKHGSTTQFPTFSHIHIHEISKGVQKLNQILRSCSNGLNFDKYSIEIGKELLRGAMDLEESLRMLVNLQEASDYMVNSQRKNKIKLLEEDEDDETENAKANDLKQLARPRFSFDKPYRNSHSTKEAEHNGITQQLLALTYPEEKQPRSRSNSFSHTRSASCVPDLKVLSTYLEPKVVSVSHSKPEKGRIPNVIAKLMGLEELPPKEESNASTKETTTKKKEKIVSEKSQIPAESKPQHTVNKPPVTANKNVASSKKSPNRDVRIMLEAEKIQASTNGSTPWQDFEVAARKDAGAGSIKTKMMTNKQQNRISQHDEMLGYRKKLQEKDKVDNKKEDREKNISKEAERKELFLNDDLQQKPPERHKLPEVKDVSEENIEVKRTAIQRGNSNASSISMSKSQNHQDNLQQPQVIKKSDHPEEKRKQQIPKQRMQASEPKGNRVESIVTLKSKNSAKSLQKKQLSAALATAAASKKKAVKHIEVKPSKDMSKSKPHEDHAIHSVHVPPRKEKANYTKSNKSETHQKVDAAVNKRNGTPHDLATSMNHQSPEKKQQKEEKFNSSKGVAQEKHTKSEEAELVLAGVVDKSEVSTEPLTGKDSLQHGVEEVASNSGEDECHILEVPKSQTCDNTSNELPTDIHEVPEVQQHGDKATLFSDGFKFKSHKALQSEHRGIHKIVHHEHKKILPSIAAEQLTESEKHLKEELIKGQLFLNTAEAIFKLNIPVSILHVNDHIAQDAETKLILDCGYELLKKKGQRQELVYPCMSIISVKVRSFDDLIKQLSKDFDMIKFYGGKNGSQECDAADYLHKMLEKDIQNGSADVSSMWDFNWNKKTFAFPEMDDLVKDLEKHLINALLDEVTRDLLYIVICS
ncbi:hypothetical protein ACH5RR_027349 [Cinchona calisaya]|uniref:DUF3741 domain-containing protein n=1 Tax=Cinchona calisaya TaxID=153742 RepID=A0ABD2Z570_9GENT